MSIERRVLGKTGLNVSAVGFGGSETGYGGTTARELAKILGSAIDDGLNLIDTAACYGSGEEQLGAALAGRRDSVILMTKCGHASGLAGHDWEPQMIARSIDRSLKRLRTDHVDIMQFHSPDPEYLRDQRVIEVLTSAHKAGKTRFIGCSGDGASAIAAIELGIFDTLQISASIADQEAIEIAIPTARERGMGVIIKRPIANAAWRDARRSADPYARPYYERLRELDYDFLKGDIEASIGLALRFTLSTPGVTTAIVGTSKPGRWQQNARHAAAGPLSASEYDAIRARWKAIARPDWVGLR